MPSFDSILRKVPDAGSKNISEEDDVDGSVNIKSPLKADGTSVSKGEDFGYSKYSENKPIQSKEINNSFPDISSGRFFSDEGAEGKRSESNYGERNEWAKPDKGQFHSEKRYGIKK